MQTIHLSAPSLVDAEALLAFELANRAFFETHINARPAHYYSLDGVRAAIAQAQQEAAADQAYQHLVRDEAGTLVGRVNLSRVRRAHYHSAELGYRIAQSACGQGYASAAVRLALARAFGELQLLRVEAIARPGNIGSLRVLANNGFRLFGRSSRSFQLHGEWHDLEHYELHAQG